MRTRCLSQCGRPGTIGGLSHLKCKTLQAGPHSMHLPTAHTCFDDYAAAARVWLAGKTRVLTAVSNCTSFGLEQGPD